MEALRKSYEKLGFTHVKSYIQSGNVVFCSENYSGNKLEKCIQNQILHEFGFDVKVKVVTVEELELVIKNNSFFKDNSLETKQHYFAFLSENPTNENWEVLKKWELSGELMSLGNKVLYLYYPNGVGKSKLTTNLIESKLKVSATTRNLNTSQKMLALGKGV